MKKLAIATFLAILIPNVAAATSLDEIYRDLVKSENEGYLPMFVKNRNAPDFIDDMDLGDVEEVKEINGKSNAPVPLINERKIRDEALDAERQRWLDAIDAIKQNKVTPVELEEVEKRVAVNDPKAMEIYAWMLSQGVGISQDLNKAFEMYQKAAILGVSGATKNAALVYKSMKPDQRALLKPLEVDEALEEAAKAQNNSLNANQ